MTLLVENDSKAGRAGKKSPSLSPLSLQFLVSAFCWPKTIGRQPAKEKHWDAEPQSTEYRRECREGGGRESGEEQTMTSADLQFEIVSYRDKYYHLHFKEEIAYIMYDMSGVTSGISP